MLHLLLLRNIHSFTSIYVCHTLSEEKKSLEHIPIQKEMDSERRAHKKGQTENENKKLHH